jgi:succinyl-CoA synthetase beta subunit
MLSSLARHASRRTAFPAVGAVRNLNVHEYVSLEIMKDHRVQTPKGKVANSPNEAENTYADEVQQGM